MMFNFATNGSVCIINAGLDLNETVINFQISNGCWHGSGAGRQGCYLKRMLELHKIIIAGTYTVKQQN